MYVSLDPGFSVDENLIHFLRGSFWKRSVSSRSQFYQNSFLQLNISLSKYKQLCNREKNVHYHCYNNNDNENDNINNKE